MKELDLYITETCKFIQIIVILLFKYKEFLFKIELKLFIYV